MAKGGGNGRLLFFVLYLLLGAYFINFGFNFMKVPTFLSNIERWIVFAGGILLVFGGINFLKSSRPGAARH